MTKENSQKPPPSKEELIELGQDRAIDGLIRALDYFDRTNHSESEPVRDNKIVFWALLPAAAAFIIGVSLSFLGISPIQTNPSQSEVDLTDALLAVEISNDVRITSPDGTTRELNRNTPIYPGDSIETSDNSSTLLALEDGTTFALGEGTKFTNLLSVDPSNPTSFALEDGFVRVSAGKQPPGEPLTIQSAFGDIEVVGTIFTVSTENDYSEIHVIEGIVDVIPEYDVFSAERVRIYENFVSRVSATELSLTRYADGQTEVSIDGFSIVDTSTGEVIKQIPVESARVSPYDIGIPNDRVGIRVEVSGPVAGLRIRGYRVRNRTSTERWPPYTVSGDSLHTGGDYFPIRFTEENKIVTLTPLSVHGGRGTAVDLELGAL